MKQRARTAHLTIELDGERVVGELRDERGAVSAFSGWLDLISAVDSLATPVRETTQTIPTFSAAGGAGLDQGGTR